MKNPRIKNEVARFNPIQKQNNNYLDMKRFSFLVLITLLVSAAVLGQKKPKLGKVESMFKTGDYAGALEMVTAAETYEKTMNNKKTFFLKGMVHAAIDTAGLDLVENPRQIARAAFDRYEEMEEEGKEESYVSSMGIFTYTQLVDQYYSFYFNKGATAYGEDDYATAVTEFGNAAEIRPNDTTAYLYAGYAASNADDYETAKMNYEKVISMGITSKDPYNLLIYIYGTVNKNNEKALEVTRTAIGVFPDDNDFKRNEIQLLIALDQLEEARNNLEKAIENEPNDPALHYSLGYLLDGASESAETDEEKKMLQERALEAYNQATVVDENYLNAYYNAGVMMINRANEIIKARNNLGISKADQKKAEEMEPQINEKLVMALPYWEKVNELEPDQTKTLETLQYLYVQLKMMDKAEEVMNKLDALSGGN